MQILLIRSLPVSLFLTLLFLAAPLSADDRFTDDIWHEDSPEEKSLTVNEGSLVFIPPVTDRPVLHSDIELLIDQTSLEQGWVKLAQCYNNINPVDSTVIVYRYRQLRSLEVVSQSSIGDISLDGQVVHLSDVRHGASLCVTAEINILEKMARHQGQGHRFRMTNGPYHLRFLDGYYPFHLSLTIVYPGDTLSICSLSPAPQPLFEVADDAGVLTIETWFEGELTIEMELVGVQDSSISLSR